jgi:hypothetical protein
MTERDASPSRTSILRTRILRSSISRSGVTRAGMLKRLCQGIGLASIILVMNYGALLGGGADVRMHVPFGLTGICLAQIADILLLGLVIFAVMALLERTRFQAWVQLMVAAVVPVFLIERTQALYSFEITDGILALIFVAWVALLLLLLLNFPRGYRRLMQIGDMAGVFFAIFAFCSIVEMLWLITWKPGPHERTAAWEVTPQPPRQHPLVVWIVFDELSYYQVFGHRANDLALPNFDALRAQSTVFTDVQPVGVKTVKVIPSLLSGQVVEDYRFTFNNRLLVHDTGQHGFHPLTGTDTVFGDAQKAGWRTAAVGWYNPYCTLYAGSIDECYWMNLDRLDGPMAQHNSFWRNTWTPLQQMVREVKAPVRAGRDDCTFDVRQRYQTHVDLQKHALQLLHTDQADFIFLHMSIPHSPNIWSRLQGNYIQFCDSSYLDNLALADRVLGTFMATLQRSPRWKDTTVIVEGDHGWRVQLWDWLPAWTPEDDVASREVFDTRPAMIIHQAGQTQPQIVSTPWSLIDVHTFVDDVLRGRAVFF